MSGLGDEVSWQMWLRARLEKPFVLPIELTDMGRPSESGRCFRRPLLPGAPYVVEVANESQQRLDSRKIDGWRPRSGTTSLRTPP
jgi:hypothetical protein